MRLALVGFLCAAAVFGQTRAERGKRIVDEALEALGGAKYLGMRNRVETGRAYSFYREELSGLSIATIYVRYEEPLGTPAKDQLRQRERQSFGKEEKSGAVLFAEGKGYEITFRGARPLPQATLDRYQSSTLNNILYILRERLNEPGMIFEYQGSDTIDNMPANKVDITDSENRTVTVYFHQSTKLPLRQSYIRRDPKTGDRIEEVTLFGKYRDAGGVLWPLDVQRFRNGDRIYQMYAENVEINTGLEDKLFELPSGIKILKPVK
ncbi:MAG TPA: hypothetical protein VHA11_05740 [Bryobacteraceae bacterium]|nr:hypothetical protein [Bryobacteraceae bacterium]